MSEGVFVYNSQRATLTVDVEDSKCYNLLMKNKIIFVVIVLIILAGFGFYLYNNDKNPAIQGQSLDETNNVNIGGVTIQGDGDMKGFKIEPIEIKNNNKPAINVPLPDLNKEIKITAEMSDDAKKIATAKIQDLSNQLKKDSDNLENWLVLGVYRKTIGDYEGAKEVWEYVTVITPQNVIALNNLGDLYAYYLKDIPKAEEYFLQAIRIEPSNIYLYFKIVEFYRDIAKDLVKARTLLEKGITANPSTSSDLKNLLENLK